MRDLAANIWVMGALKAIGIMAAVFIASQYSPALAWAVVGLTALYFIIKTAVANGTGDRRQRLDR